MTNTFPKTCLLPASLTLPASNLAATTLGERAEVAEAWEGQAEQRTWVACQEAPLGTALDSHHPVPAAGVDRGVLGWRGAGQAGLPTPSGLGPVPGEVRNFGS